MYVVCYVGCGVVGVVWWSGGNWVDVWGVLLGWCDWFVYLVGSVVDLVWCGVVVGVGEVVVVD